MRILVLALLLCAASSCGPVATTGTQGSTDLQSAPDTVQLHLYERRRAKNGEVLVPPVLLRLSGTLGQKNSCLIVRSGDGDHVLVFEKGKATFDATKEVLIIGSATFRVGEPISVGGPFNQPAESFDPAVIKERCGVNAVWLVTGADVRPNP